MKAFRSLLELRDFIVSASGPFSCGLQTTENTFETRVIDPKLPFTMVYNQQTGCMAAVEYLG